MVDASTVRLETSEVPVPGDGEALLKIRYLSIDPTIRTWMNDAPGYLPPIQIDEVVRGAGISEVVESRSERYKVGDLVFGMCGWQEYTIADQGPNAAQAIPEGLDPPTALNVFGVTGLTAYFGLLDVGKMNEGDVVVVSGAAGATGSSVGQMAKINGASKVVGIAGGPEKCAFVVEELGFDACIDYREDRVAHELGTHCPDGIDLYFDNVGGSILNACLGRLAMRGTVVLCGAIAHYNDTDLPPGPSNYVNLIPKRGRMEGFIILDYAERFAEAQGAIFGWLLEGKIKHFEEIVEGLEKAPDALNMLFTGQNTGKVVVRL
jgi:hypothetical protein